MRLLGLVVLRGEFVVSMAVIGQGEAKPSASGPGGPSRPARRDAGGDAMDVDNSRDSRGRESSYNR